MLGGRAHLTFTNRLLLPAVLIVAITTLLLMVTTFAGVSELASNAQSTREAALRDVLVSEVDGWLQGSYEILRATTDESVLTSATPSEVVPLLSSFTLDNYQYFEGVAFLDAQGAVIAAWPQDVFGDSTPASLGALETSSATSPFLWESPTTAQTTGRLWVVASAENTASPGPILMGRLRVSFVERALSDISKLHGQHTALIFDNADHPIYRSGGAFDLSRATFAFSPEAGSSTSGSLRVQATEMQVGPYAEIPASRNLGWKAAVVEPPSLARSEAWAALRTGVLGWAAALAVALIASLAVVRRATRPLRELEAQARALASGSLVQTDAVAGGDEVGRLLDAFNSVAMRLNRLNDIADLLASATDRSMVLAGVASSIVHMLRSVDAEVLLLDERGHLDLVAAQGTLAGREGVSFEADQVPWIAIALSSGQPTPVTRAAEDAFFDLHGEDARYALAAPLRAGAGAIGAAVVVRHGEPPFSDAECETVRSFAAQASAALQTSRLFEDERRSRHEAEALRAVAERVAALGGVEETLGDIASKEADLLGFDETLVVLRDRATYGLPVREDDPAGESWLAGWYALESQGETGAEPVYVDLGVVDERVSSALRASGAIGALLTPLHRGTTLAGLIVLLVKDWRSAPSRRRLELAGTAGRQASLALENAYLFQQAKSRADNLETIFRISHAVGSSLQSRVVLNRVLDVVQKILAADAVMLMTYDPQRRQITVPMARGILNREMLEATFRPGEDVPGRVFETCEPERYDRISGADTRLLNSAAEQGLESLLAVPLLARGRSIGVLAVFARAESAFTSDELDLLRTFASQAALAIDTAELFSREHNVAMILQESIRPTRLPHIPGIDASSVYLPAGTDADIGGDYYDLFIAPDGRVVVSIGDVCGKGAAAATKTSMIRYAIRGMVVAGLEPGRVLYELNGMLLEAQDASSIVTLWLGYIDLHTGMLVYANGGHPPALLLRPSGGRIERLATTGALLGAVSGTSWSQHEVRLDPDALILLYTDGVTEARNGVRFFGEGRVRRALRAGGTATSVAQRVFARVQRFAAGDLRDDAAILTVAYRPSTQDTVSDAAADTGRK